MPSAKADEDVTLIAVVSHELDEMSVSIHLVVHSIAAPPSFAWKTCQIQQSNSTVAPFVFVLVLCNQRSFVGFFYALI